MTPQTVSSQALSAEWGEQCSLFEPFGGRSFQAQELFLPFSQTPTCAQKRCCKCGELKDLSAFRRIQRRKNLENTCKRCARKLWGTPRKRRWNHKKAIQNRASRLRAKHGDVFADAYLTMALDEQAPVRVPVTKILAKALNVRWKRSTLRRLLDINLASKLPAVNIGWSCSQCGMKHDSPLFFDVDHIVPKSKGGTNDPSNLQLLCPNCHKGKTIQDIHVSHPLRSKAVGE